MSTYTITADKTALGSAYVGNQTLTATVTIEATVGTVNISNIVFSNKDFKLSNAIFPKTISKTKTTIFSGNNNDVMEDVILDGTDIYASGYSNSTIFLGEATGYTTRLVRWVFKYSVADAGIKWVTIDNPTSGTSTRAHTSIVLDANGVYWLRKVPNYGEGSIPLISRLNKTTGSIEWTHSSSGTGSAQAITQDATYLYIAHHNDFGGRNLTRKITKSTGGDASINNFTTTGYEERTINQDGTDFFMTYMDAGLANAYLWKFSMAAMASGGSLNYTATETGYHAGLSPTRFLMSIVDGTNRRLIMINPSAMTTTYNQVLDTNITEGAPNCYYDADNTTFVVSYRDGSDMKVMTVADQDTYSAGTPLSITADAITIIDANTVICTGNTEYIGLTLNGTYDGDATVGYDVIIDDTTGITPAAETLDIGVLYKPSIDGDITCEMSFTSDADSDQTATFTATGLLLNDTKDYQVKAQETWESISIKIYGSRNFVDVLKSNNPQLTLKQKKSIFAPKGIWLYTPDVQDDDRLELEGGAQDITPWYEV